jgi:transmembrane sensor
MDYYQFTAEELAADEYFRAWVCAPTPESDAFWQRFLQDFPERYYQVEEARRLILGLQELHDSNAESVTAAVIWERIEHTIDTLESTPSVRTHSWFWRVGGWAAAAVVVLALGYAWQKGGIAPTEKTEVATKVLPAWMEAVNSSDKMMLIQLSDGSRVELETNSRLKYPRRFQDDKREVHLEGGAFFDVEKNPKLPFLVFADQIVTRVLGTSFRVKAFPEEQSLTVAVRTGKVIVFAREDYRKEGQKSVDKRVIALTPNQQVHFSKKNAEFQKTLVSNPTLIVTNPNFNNFDFDETPVGEILQKLEQAYGVKIIYNSDLLKDCALTASISEETLTEKLDLICKSIGANYEIIDGNIIIHSKGCQ